MNKKGLIKFVFFLCLLLGRNVEGITQCSLPDCSILSVKYVKVELNHSDGKWECNYNCTSSIAIKGEYKGEAMSGLWEVYDTNGTIREIVHFDQGKIRGNYCRFDENGTKTMEGNYLGNDTMEQNVNVIFFPVSYSKVEKSNNRLIELQFEPKKTGEWRYYNTNGNLIRKENYDSTGRMKVAIFFNEVGSVIEEGHDNSLTPYESTYRIHYKLTSKGSVAVANGFGSDTTYYDKANLQIKSIIPYRDGLIEGKATYFKLDGKIEKEVMYKEGRII